MHPLPINRTFDAFALLYLNGRGRFVDPGRDLDELTDGTEIAPAAVAQHLQRNIVLPRGVTDVFVWVHGWRNDHQTALGNSRRLFAGILSVAAARAAQYPGLTPFVPAFVAVRWPSQSSALPAGYERIRDRAALLTTDGDAEFFLASLLGYLDQRNHRGPGPGSRTLRAKGGFYVHCLGHSFGGRFLTAAVRAAASPQLRTLSLAAAVPPAARKVLGAAAGQKFAFTVDSMIVFQMAAPRTNFSDQLRVLTMEAPLRGPLVLTHSSHDRANCVWHRVPEGETAIGCGGAAEPADLIASTPFRGLSEAYDPAVFSSPIVNVDADAVFTRGRARFEGAHSDFWYEESIHLILSVADFTRTL